MGSLEKAVGSLLESATSSIRRFTAFLFLVFIGGMLIGARIAQTNASFLPTAIIVPAFLAVVSYFYTEAAILFFLLFALIFIFL